MIQHLARQIHKLLLKNKKTIAVAESCTGGLVSKLLTDTKGSSAYFILGTVAYSNSAKNKVLGIPRGLLNKYGAVSGQVAAKMSEAVRKLAKADFGLGITGIAGPSGGSPQKPVGTVFIAASDKNRTTCRKFLFSGNRNTVRTKAANKALVLLKYFLSN